MSTSVYKIGNAVRVSAVFTDTGGSTDDPTTVKIRWTVPSETTTKSIIYSASTGNVVKASSGNYYLDIVTTGQGYYTYEWSSTGSIISMSDGFFYVDNRVVTT